MKTESFNTLEELNQFMKTLDPGIPPITRDMIPVGHEGPFKITMIESPEELATFGLGGQTAKQVDFSAGMAQGKEAQAGVLGSAEAVRTPEVEPEYNDREQQLLNQLEATLRVSTDQLALVMGQRDAEIEDHEACHAEFEATYNRDVYAARIKGYAEAISAGYFPGKHIMSIPKNYRDIFYRQARESVESIVAAELAYEARHGATQH